MWDEFDDSAFTTALSGNASASTSTAPATASGPVPMDEDGDADMWDVVRELEEEQARLSKQVQSLRSGGDAQPTATPAMDAVPEASASATSAAASEAPPAQTQEKPRATNDEGWDEMYL